MDLFSTVIQLHVNNKVDSIGFTGLQVQTWLLGEIKKHKLEWFEALHPKNKGPVDGIKAGNDKNKLLLPFTLSLLLKGEKIPSNVNDGDWCLIRITSLKKDLSQYLKEEFLPNLSKPDKPSTGKIGRVEFYVKPWEEESEKLSTQETYKSLGEKANKIKSINFTLNFSSVTTFKNNNENKASDVEKDIPLPIPEMVFGSYLDHWNKFSGDKITLDMIKFFHECLTISRLKNLETERVQLSPKNSHRASTGFLGNVDYIILGNSKKSQFGNEWEDCANIVRKLALYSRYCGTGHRTTMGLGQTIPEFSKK